MTELRSFTRQHLTVGAVDEGTVVALVRGLARRLLGEALHRAGGLRIDVLTRSRDFYLGLGARQVPGFRLIGECLATDGGR